MNIENIKVVVFDLDGTLTNGMYEVNSEGIVSKQFYTRDFYGIEKLIKNNIKVMIMTQCTGKVISAKLRELDCTPPIWREFSKEEKILLCTKVENKKELLLDLIKDTGILWNFTLENIAYMGDADNDLECMKLVGYTACPSDATNKIMKESSFVSNYKGGYGAVYEFCMDLLEKKGVEL